jgi:SNF2 family DNA or RNA helicase
MGEKVFVYSTYNDVAELAYERLTAEYKMYFTTEMLRTGKNYDSVLNRMRTNVASRVMCSGEQGSVGINLLWANHIIIMEPDGNSQKTRQAVARLHRIGQTRPVHVYQLIAKLNDPNRSSLEEKMYSIAKNESIFIDSEMATASRELLMNLLSSEDDEAVA